MKKRIRTHTNPLNIRQRLDQFSLEGVLGEFQSINLEIGFGRGRFMSSYAQKYTNELMVGVEVRKQMVEVFKANHHFQNCIPIWGAGFICLQDVIPDRSLDRVFIFHPDPWFKKRHHKRRVINLELIRLLRQKMAPQGVVFISTDVYELYDEIMSVLRHDDDKTYIQDNVFWKTDYRTHWSSFSIQDLRSSFFATFKFKEEN
ncbi:MAG: hypothetical protein VW397_02855 [Candidatus Margulisiibacteriota bacterium]